ncbi:MAG: AmmeMemoRadiSam system radical SAM enzyme [Chloroflexota bacterium]
MSLESILADAHGLKEAELYDRLPGGCVRCRLCGHRCVIAEGKVGVCGVRKNVGGKLYTLVYGRVVSRHADPIEKKPLFHFYPGSTAYSIATPGCNFHCRWCQNWSIARPPDEAHLLGFPEVDPQRIVDAALAHGSRSIAYTYTEPTVFFEYSYDVARLAHQAGLANVYVTNGYMSTEMLDAFHPYLDAANVDLKAFRKETYRRYVGARLQTVLDNLKTMKRLGIWLEVTTLVIPDLNDEPEELRDAVRFIVQELGADTPWHVSRFYPAHEMTDRPQTPLPTLQWAAAIGREEGLRYVYIGNVWSAGDEDTICPGCGRTLIRRAGFKIIDNDIQDGQCPHCDTRIAGVGMGGA